MLTAHDLVEHLVRLGLDARAASTFVQLSLMGEGDALAYALREGIGVEEAARRLDDLVRRGLASREGARYAAVPGDVAVERLREASPRAMAQAPAPRFEIFTGREAHLEAALGVFRRASVLLRIATTFPGTVALGEGSGATALVLDRLRQGVHLQMAMQTTPEVRLRLAPLLAFPSAEVRHIETVDVIRTLIGDDREAISVVVSGAPAWVEAPEEASVWSDAPGFVANQVALFEALWQGGADVRQMIEDDRAARRFGREHEM